jgi:hypothetical protein
LQPYAAPWYDAESYPSIYGRTDISFVTFAKFGQNRCSGGKRDFAIAGHDQKAFAADAWHPVYLKQIELIDVDFKSTVYLHPPDPKWLNSGDCIDMDCDGPKVIDFKVILGSRFLFHSR